MKPRYQRKVEKLAKMLGKAIEEGWLAGLNMSDVNKTTGRTNTTFHKFFTMFTKVFVDKRENDEINIEMERY